LEYSGMVQKLFIDFKKNYNLFRRKLLHNISLNWHIREISYAN
jgi:hypothetical protein